jgi:hypothetical protein
VKELKLMAKRKIGQVFPPTAGTPSYYGVYWDDVTQEVYVEGGYAGKASTESQAMHIADVYCSTGKQTNP